MEIGKLAIVAKTPNPKALLRAIWKERPFNPQRLLPAGENLRAAYTWLCTAQDATPDNGVAAGYSFFRGWDPSYPETTGYIIPTFLTYASIRPEAQARGRALRMADWEIEVQLPSGAVQSGFLGKRRLPAVFNTGQVLFGWVSAYEATGDDRYAQAAQRAASWLLEQQDPDGAWRRNLSALTTSIVQTHNTRTAWGLALAGTAFHERTWIKAAVRNCQWALRQQQPSGWFRHNGFADFESPLLHTIGYALEGMLGVGELLQEDRFIQSARRGAAPLVHLHRRSGSLKGRYDEGWSPTVSWRCLTGEAQIAMILLRLTRCTGSLSYGTGLRETAAKILRDLSRLQDISSPYPETHGAINGATPLWGLYCPFAYPSWAAKFFMDAMMLYLYDVDVQPSAQSTLPAKESA